MARDLAKEKGREREFAFLELLEERAVETFMNFKGNKVNKRVCANVDFYSGFVYDLIGLPREVFTPLFAMSRIAGWTAHRIEELNFDSKRIIRPAYRNVSARPANQVKRAHRIPAGTEKENRRNAENSQCRETGKPAERSLRPALLFLVCGGTGTFSPDGPPFAGLFIPAFCAVRFGNGRGQGALPDIIY